MPKLFYDDEFDALAQTIGNSERSFKECAVFLYPHLKPETAYARLKACLNPDKDERLTLGQIIALCDFCKTYDAHYFMADELNHERGGVKNPADEIATLQREFLKGAKGLEHIAARIEQLAQPRIKIA